MKHITESRRQASAEWRSGETYAAMAEVKMRAMSTRQLGGRKRWSR